MAEDCEGRVNLLFPFYGWMCPDEDNGIYLSTIAVHPTMRRKGHFASLIQELKTEYTTIKLPVPFGPMRLVLEKWGFVEHTEFDENICEDVIVMLWSATGN
jgi:predicted acetyltransferase